MILHITSLQRVSEKSDEKHFPHLVHPKREMTNPEKEGGEKEIDRYIKLIFKTSYREQYNISAQD